MNNLSKYLDLSFLVKESNFNQEDVDAFSVFFDIPPQHHNLHGQLEQLYLITMFLHREGLVDVSKHLAIIEHLQLKQNDSSYLNKLVTQVKGDRSGLASTYPIYNALLSAPHNTGVLNVFEVLIGLLIAVHQLKPDISPNPSNASNLISITREIRKQSKQSSPVYQQLKSELFSLDLDFVPSLVLEKYLEITGVKLPEEKYLTPSTLSVELMSLVSFFLKRKKILEKPNETLKLNEIKVDEDKPSKKIVEVSEPQKKTKHLTTTEILKLLDVINAPSTTVKPSRPFFFNPQNIQEDVNKLGVLAEDDDNEVPIVVNEQIDGQEISSEGNAAAAKASQKKGVMDAQFSKYRWDRYSPFELMLILRAAEEKQVDLGAMAALLSLSLGAEPLVWGEYQVKQQAEFPYIDIKNACWGHPVEVHSTAWRPADDQKCFVKDVGEFCHLALEYRLVVRIKGLTCNADASTVAELFNSTPLQLNDLLTKFLLSIKERNREFTIAKVREVLYSTIMDLTMDEVAAQMICGQPTYLLPVQSFYTALSFTKLQEIYEAAMNVIFQFSKFETAVNDQIIGSKLQPLDAVVRRFVEKLKIPLNTSINDVIDYHNHYTVYTYLLLSMASGHRYVQDPFTKTNDFIEPLKGVVIYDKFTDPNHSGRMSVLGSTAWIQFENYKKHLLEMSHLLNEEHRLVSSRIHLLLQGRKTLPFLFLMEKQGSAVKIISVTESEIKGRLKHWGLPFNFNRHLLASKLREFGGPAEMIDYQLGHFQNGTQPLGIGSMLSLKVFSETLSPLIDRVLDFYDFTPMKSFVSATQKANKFVKCADVELAYQARINVFNKKRAKAKDVITNITFEVETELLILDRESISFKDDANKIIKDKLSLVLNHTDTLSSSDSLIAYGNAIKLLITKNKLKFKSPIQFSKFSTEISPINFKSGDSYFLVQSFRSEFTKQLPKLVESHTEDTERLAILLLIEVVFGYLHCPQWVKNFIQSYVSSTFSEDGETYIDLRYSSKNESFFRYRLSKISQFYLQSQSLNVGVEQEDLFQESVDNVLGGFLTLAGFKPTAFNQFLKIFSSAGTFELPGTLRAITSGEIKSYSVKAPRFVSQIKNKPMIDKPYFENSNDRNLNDITARSVSKNPNYRATKAKIKEIRNLFKGYDKTKQNASQKQRLQSVINEALGASDEIYPVYFYILQWGKYLLAQKDSVDTIKVVTLNNKIHLNAVGLAEVFRDSDLAILDEVDFIAAYNKVLEYYPSFQDETKQVINHLTALVEFHEFMVNSFGVPEIDLSDLDLPEELSGYIVSANYLSEPEYLEILNELKRDCFVTELQRAYQSTIFFLGFNFGGRSAEIFSLMLKDIQLLFEDGFLGSITIQPNRLGTLKTDASKRNLPMHIWLTPEEIELITDFYQIRIAQGAKPEDPLFAGLSDDYVRDIRIIKNRIVQLMRHFTGDATLKFHSLRHSFANLMAKGLFQDEVWGCSDSFKMSTLQRHFDFSESRRGLFQVARLIGHGHPATTVINYIHCFDELLFNYSSANCEKYNFSYDWFASFLPVTTVNLRKMKSRQNVPLLEVVKKYLIAPPNFSELVLSSGNKSLPPPVQMTIPRMGFKQISWLMSRYFLVKDQSRLAQLLEVDLDEIAKIMDAIVAISNISGYLPDPLVNLVIPLQFQKDFKPNKKPRQDIDGCWVRRFEDITINQGNEQFFEAIKLWMQYVHPNGAGWKFEKWTQYEKFVEFLKLTGVDKKLIKFRGEASDNIPLSIRVEGFSKHHKSKLTRKYFNLNFEKLNLELVVTSNRGGSNINTFNFFFFLAAVILFTGQSQRTQELLS